MPSLLQQTRFALGELGIRPYKHLGQHFLIDPDVIHQMTQAAQLAPQTPVLEIGPGLGVVSDALVDVGARLYLVEVDRILAQRLEQRFARFDNVQVLTADFLKLDLARAFSDAPISVVASLPYQVATPILFRLLDHRQQFPEATVMIQKEVAQRVCAEPGTKAYGVISVLIQLHATVETICTVGPHSFFPAPKVESQVIRLVFQTTPQVTLQDERVFQRLVKAAFAQRRKTLRNALRAGGFPPLEDLAERLGIQLQRRGETLSLQEFAALANALVADGFAVPGRPEKKVSDQID